MISESVSRQNSIKEEIEKSNRHVDTSSSALRLEISQKFQEFVKLHGEKLDELVPKIEQLTHFQTQMSHALQSVTDVNSKINNLEKTLTSHSDSTDNKLNNLKIEINEMSTKVTGDIKVSVDLVKNQLEKLILDVNKNKEIITTMTTKVDNVSEIQKGVQVYKNFQRIILRKN